jgi:hypothetical protein
LGSGKNLFLIPNPDQGVKKALDPGSATMLGTVKKIFSQQKRKYFSQQKRIQVFLNHRTVTKLLKIWNWDPEKTYPGSG